MIFHFNPRGLYRPRQPHSQHLLSGSKFQSTRPIQASTYFTTSIDLGNIFQSTRPIQASTRAECLIHALSIFQSTRPIQASTDRIVGAIEEGIFQSTRPIQASTIQSKKQRRARKISIHEAYTGLDFVAIRAAVLYSNFNPRGLYRPRLYQLATDNIWSYFNPRGLYRPRQVC